MEANSADSEANVIVVAIARCSRCRKVESGPRREAQPGARIRVYLPDRWRVIDGREVCGECDSGAPLGNVMPNLHPHRLQTGSAAFGETGRAMAIGDPPPDASFYQLRSAA